MKRHILGQLAAMAAMTATVLLGACGGGGGGGEEGASVPEKGLTTPSRQAEVVTAVSGSYEIAILDGPGRTSYAMALNDAGQVAGNYIDADGTVSAFFWDGARLETIASSAQASDINGLGQVVGWTEAGAEPRPFFYDAGQDRLFLFPEAGKAFGINGRGETVGFVVEGGKRPFLETGNALTVVPGDWPGYGRKLDDSGRMLLVEWRADGFGTVVAGPEGRRDLGSLGGGTTQGSDLNGAGDVVGWSLTADGQTHAFLWRQGTMRDLGAGLGDFNSAVAVSEDGTVLIKATAADGQTRTRLWRDGQSADLGNLGFGYLVPADLNNRGQIAGWLQTPAGEIRAFLATPKTVH